ncbi:AMIN domain-containing protein, partial [Aduncisulcus paluster]
KVEVSRQQEGEGPVVRIFCNSVFTCGGKKEGAVFVAEKPVEEPKAPEPKVADSKAAEQKKKIKKPSKAAVAKRIVSKVSFSCGSAKASVDVALSAAPGKVSWFNLAKPR